MMMARFQNTGSYSGKGQKDLRARIASLKALGEPEPPRNATHPHLYSRRHVIEAEQRLGVVWLGVQKRHETGTHKC